MKRNKPARREKGPRKGPGEKKGTEKRPAAGDTKGEPQSLQLRIVGGSLRGRIIAYLGDRRTRPMKNRVREAVFNLLGPTVREALVLDLFAGTGAMALEAISRGATRAIAIERHFPTVNGIRQNARSLQVETLEVVPADAFHWVERHLPEPQGRWIVFCCPPYDFYVQRAAQMRQLIETLLERCPSGSLVVVESDQRFDATRLPQPERWDVRTYPPAQIAIYEA